MSLSRDEIRLGYLFVLAREPESEAIYAQWSPVDNALTFRTLLLESEEGKEKIKLDQKINTQHPCVNFARKSFCFIHLEKTGGTTFHTVFAKYFDSDRVSPIQMPNLHSFTASELGHYDFISGHFDYSATKFIPRPSLKRIAIFREPIDRLISFYRFHRCHPSAIAQSNEFVALAQSLEPEDFFRHPNVVRSPRLNNAYLRVFSTSLYETIPAEESRGAICDALQIAKERVVSLDAFGLIEHMDLSVRIMLRQLGFEPSSEFEYVHRTNEFTQKLQGFQKAPPVARTQALYNAAAPLVHADVQLYDWVAKEFQKRVATLEDAYDTATTNS